MDRKTFIKKTVGAVLITIPAYSLIGCSNDDSANGDPDLDPEQADCLANGANASSISGNHGHTLVVAKADIEAGVEKNYSIKGGSGHDHEIVVSAGNFAKLKNKEAVKIDSSTNSLHKHTVTVSCA
ncbi:MAG: hypothetical protein COC08_03070 [Maribacter sp.]|nr:MAG: hypothetical protein COC08_03070 [Maribacter sp.]